MAEPLHQRRAVVPADHLLRGSGAPPRSGGPRAGVGTAAVIDAYRGRLGSRAFRRAVGAPALAPEPGVPARHPPRRPHPHDAGTSMRRGTGSASASRWKWSWASGADSAAASCGLSRAPGASWREAGVSSRHGECSCEGVKATSVTSLCGPMTVARPVAPRAMTSTESRGWREEPTETEGRMRPQRSTAWLIVVAADLLVTCEGADVAQRRRVRNAAEDDGRPEQRQEAVRRLAPAGPAWERSCRQASTRRPWRAPSLTRDTKVGERGDVGHLVERQESGGTAVPVAGQGVGGIADVADGRHHHPRELLLAPSCGTDVEGVGAAAERLEVERR